MLVHYVSLFPFNEFPPLYVPERHAKPRDLGLLLFLSVKIISGLSPCHEANDATDLTYAVIKNLIPRGKLCLRGERMFNENEEKTLQITKRERAEEAAQAFCMKTRNLRG